MAEDAALLSCRGLSKTYGKDAGLVRAVNVVDLDVATGERSEEHTSELQSP